MFSMRDVPQALMLKVEGVGQKTVAVISDSVKVVH